MQERAWQAVVDALAERVANNPRGELSIIAGEIGATRGTVSRWLSGDLKGRRIPYDKMLHIMQVLNLNPAEYFSAPSGVVAGAGSVADSGAAPGIASGAAAGTADQAKALPGARGGVADNKAGSANVHAGTARAGAQPFAPLNGQAAAPTAAAQHADASFMAAAAFPQPYLPEDSDYYQVPWLEARASMGGGSLEVSKEVKSYLSFRRDWLLSKGQIGSMVVVSVQGDSMSPTIPDGSVVLINEAVNSPPVNNKIYFVCYREELFLKRLKVVDGRAVALISDFDGSEVSIRDGEYFNIIGRAIWYGKDL